MEKWLSIVAIMIAIPTIAFPIINHLGFLTNLDLEPTTESINNEHHIEKVAILNHGIMQAKNVDVFIEKNNMNLTSSFCLEGTINDNIDTDDYLKIHFPKMSVGFECILTFIGKNDTGIEYAWISEEDRIADEWYLSKDGFESRIFWMNHLPSYFFIGYVTIILYVIWLLRITPKNNKKLESDSKFRTCLPDKHGKFLRNYDEKLILAIYEDKNNYESLHEELKFNKRFIKRRVNFLYKKKILVSKDPISLDPDIKKKIKGLKI